MGARPLLCGPDSDSDLSEQVAQLRPRGSSHEDQKADPSCEMGDGPPAQLNSDLIKHGEALIGTFGVASAFALSFGIKKFQITQEEINLLGEIVGRLGRRPDPAMCEAIREWSLCGL